MTTALEPVSPIHTRKPTTSRRGRRRARKIHRRARRAEIRVGRALATLHRALARYAANIT